MKDTIDPLQGIIDITGPVVPWQYALENTLRQNMTPTTIFLSLFAAGTLAAILYFCWRHFFSLRGKAKRKIRALQQHHHRQAIDGHSAAFQLANILRDSLNLAQLSTRTPLPGKLQKYNDRWQAFTKELSIIRYAPTDDAQHKLPSLFIDAHFWLSYWPLTKND